MSRTMAVVLFTDLVGSTELRGRLGEEAADELRRKHDQLLAQAVEANNGRLVKGLGDGVMATFAGAADAVVAAVAIQQAVDRLNRSGKSPVPLAVRVGLSAGDVAFEDEDVHGTPVIEAARLCGAAGGAEILVSEMVRWLARAGASQVFTSVGNLELKGLADPVPAVRVEWEPAAVSTVPMPALLTELGRIFVGRDAELDRLGQLWKEAAAGERRVALLAGEPGVGKTRLAAELSSKAHAEGGIVLAGRCDEDLGVPYQPFVEALRHFVDHVPPDELRVRLGRFGGELSRLVPELTERARDLPPPLQSDPETERYRLFDAVAGWMAAVEEPLLLVVDDLQWAAKPTLLLLRHVVRSPTKRVLILGTYRDTELTHDHPLVELVADLRRESGVERLPMSGLDDVGVAAFLEQASGQSLDEDGVALARAIHEETEGNPFFVREVLRHLAETGAVHRVEHGWTTRLPVEELGIPEGVRDVVGRRVARLSSHTNQALRVAAVVGSEFELPVVQAAGRLDDETLLAALEEAAGARLVTEASTGRYRFAHALVRDTLYEGLSAARRVDLHRKVAEAIEAVHAGALDDHLPALAHHYTRASTPAALTDKAVTYAARAGDRALSQLANDEAARYYHHTLELVEVGEGGVDEAQRLELLISLGEAERRAGDPAHRETLLEAARLAHARGDAGALARAALANSRGFLMSAAGAVDQERIAALEAAVTALSETSAIRARLLANLAMELMYAGDFPRRSRLSEEALAVARQLDDPATLVPVLVGRFNAIATSQTLAERLALTAELVELIERLSDPAIHSRAWFVRYRATLEAGDMAEADRAIAALTELASELNQPVLHWTLTWVRAGRHLLAGRIAEADAEAQAVMTLGRATGQPDADQFFYHVVFPIRWEQDRLGDLEETWTEIVPRFPRFSTYRAMLALLYCEVGRPQEGREALEPFAASGFDLPPDVAWGQAVTYSAAACSHLGDTAGAAQLRGHLAPYARQFPLPAAGAANGAIAHYLGLLATTLEDWAEADTYFRTAADIHARAGAPGWLARTRLEWAHMLLARRQPGDAQHAHELLGKTLDTARELGLANVERRAVKLLA
jgi:class 3 adenylate cyclase